MQNPPMFYREEKPNAAISHLVLSFWEFRVAENISAPVTHEIFPDGCVSVIFYCNKTAQSENLFVSAINPQSIYVSVNAGDKVWGMRILPEARRKFFGEISAKINYQSFQTQNTELRNQLKNCDCFSQAVKIFENYTKEFDIRREEIDERLTKATRIFIATQGLAKIAETAKEIGLSERQFERNYRKASGITPKQFARICRFRATTIDMIKNSTRNWANRAAEKGFTDQSHLNREFSKLTGNSPIAFSENVKRIKHDNILE